MVSADISKELQNVLPNGNPFALQIEYHIYGVGTVVDGAAKRLSSPRSLTTAYNSNCCKCYKFGRFSTALTAATAFDRDESENSKRGVPNLKNLQNFPNSSLSFLQLNLSHVARHHKSDTDSDDISDIKITCAFVKMKNFVHILPCEYFANFTICTSSKAGGTILPPPPQNKKRHSRPFLYHCMDLSTNVY
jgi:hypothetical protein